MTDLLQVLPDFDTKPHTHLLPSLDKALITTSDLLTLGPSQAAKRAQLPAGDLKKLTDDIVSRLHGALGFGAEEEADGGNSVAVWDLAHDPEDSLHCITTLDEQLDGALCGGILPGHLVEVTGESGAGKTQLLLTLLLSVQLPPPSGLGKSAIYISTESHLATNRLSQLLATHPALASLSPKEKPSLSRILSIQCPDLESQEHILRYQLPVAVTRNNVGLVILDSVAANYRAEFEKKGDRNGLTSMAQRSSQLVELGTHLRDLAFTHGIAIVVANQVADRFTRPPSVPPSRHPSGNSQVSDGVSTPVGPSGALSNAIPNPSTPAAERITLSADPLTLDHQQNWFTGWGDIQKDPSHTLKTPSLGHVWTNQLSARIALLKRPIFGLRPLVVTVNGEDQWNDEEVQVSKWRRWMKVVFAPWAPPSEGRGVEYEISPRGLRHI